MLFPALTTFVLAAGLPQPLATEPDPASVPPRSGDVVTLEHDNTRITRSCTVVIPPGLIIPDADGDGVLHVEADGVTVEFAEGSVLAGADASTPDDALAGVGIRIVGRKGVTIRGARVSGFKAGIYATGADDLTIEDVRVDRNFRQRLRSTVQAEDTSDWLWPHRNDDNQWLERYGAAVYIEDASAVTVRRTVVRNSQNGLVLDRVSGSTVYDNDCSFLSGWGLAMWRSSGNLVSRNAFDFCIRGYSHDVYNRGQDSAGILCFEQCSQNRFLENSATHCGDGFFCFAGREALGEEPPPRDDFDYARRGCNANLIAGNDFSFAAAHGIEITFSFNNVIVGNRLVGNAICGVWGGYSQSTLLADNTILDNGPRVARLGAEGGGINIEHGVRNTVLRNTFGGNSVAVHAWNDEDPGLARLPWAAANSPVADHLLIAHNTFNRTQAEPGEQAGESEAALSPDVLLRDAGRVLLFGNQAGDAADLSIESLGRNRVELLTSAPRVPPPQEVEGAIGDSRPVGARAGTPLDGGRDLILMGEWGPWDRESIMLRPVHSAPARRIYEVLGDAGPLDIEIIEGKGDLETLLGEVDPVVPRSVILQPRAGINVLPYVVRIASRDGRLDRTLSGTLVHAEWRATIFPSAVDPRDDLEAWRAQSRGPSAVTTPTDDLAWMRLGRRAPRDLPFLREFKDRLPGPENYGVIARTKVHLPAGDWRVSTLSDDGVRVLVDGRTVLENWTHHAPARDEAVFNHPAPGPVEIMIEYFQLDGHATLEFAIEPERPSPSPAPVPRE